MTTLHVFDMDGTLLRGSTASLEIARRLGCLTELVALEEAFACGALDTVGFASGIHELWATLDVVGVRAAFESAPWIAGIADVFADIRERGEHSLVITMSPDFFAERLRDRGADEVVASRFPPVPFRRPLDPAGILRPVDKVSIADRVLARYGLDRNACVAYGDSMSDAPLFAVLRHTVAVNADIHLRQLGNLHYDGDDLRQAYRGVREMLASSTPPVVPG
ncbi:MAG TPA: haloacid dehalogenase-like hydrolase [Mycobacteriales bacterium]|jgi:Phosphoserine phosphatase